MFGREVTVALALGLALIWSRPLRAEGEVSPPVSSSAPVFSALGPAPDKYSKVIWIYDGKQVVGYWFTADQIIRVDAENKKLKTEVEYLSDKAGKECFDASVGESYKILGSKPALWVAIAGGLLAGFITGYIVAKR